MPICPLPPRGTRGDFARVQGAAGAAQRSLTGDEPGAVPRVYAVVYLPIQYSMSVWFSLKPVLKFIWDVLAQCPE
jgi:hypothetical protein